MDDCVFICRSRTGADRVRHEVEYIVEYDLNLKIKPNGSIFSIAQRGIDFVGFRIFFNAVILRKTLYNDLVRTCRRIKSVLARRGFINTSEKSAIMSYWGWASHCTNKARNVIYQMHFKPIFISVGVEL